MPRPPLLPTLDWPGIFQRGRTFETWCQEDPEKEKIQEIRRALEALDLDPPLAAALAHLPRTVHVIAIAEAWCGDVVRHVPVLEKMAHVTGGKLQTRYIAREGFLDVFVRYLTNGGEAIPKFVFLTDNWVEVGNWGPMPSEARRLIARGKAAGDGKGARERVTRLYESDPRRERTATELAELALLACCAQS